MKRYLYSRPIPIEQIELLLAAPASLAGVDGGARAAGTAIAAPRPKRRSKRT
jgi:hypothetical protein